MFVGIADHATHPRKRSNLFRCALRVASCNHNLAIRVLAPDATNGCSCVLVCGSGHRACVQYNDLRLSRGGRSRQTALLELTLESGTIGLRSPAAKVLYVKTCHRFLARRGIVVLRPRVQTSILSQPARRKCEHVRVPAERSMKARGLEDETLCRSPIMYWADTRCLALGRGR